MIASNYGAILSDPPWAFKTWSAKGEGRSASKHYGTMGLEDIKRLPVADWAAKDSCLFLWAVDPMLPQALELMKAWGFTFKTVAFYWMKTNRDGKPFTGMGHWTRANCEQVLFGTRGKPTRISKSVRRLVVAPRREHSRKPEQVRDGIERLVAGPYLEMFARSRRKGWDVFGNETEKFDREQTDIEEWIDIYKQREVSECPLTLPQ